MLSTVSQLRKPVTFFAIIRLLLAFVLFFPHLSLGADLCKNTFKTISSRPASTTPVNIVDYHEFPPNLKLDLSSVPENATTVVKMDASARGRFLVTDDLLTCVGIVIADHQNNVALMSHFVTLRSKYETAEGLTEYVQFLEGFLAKYGGKIDGASVYILSGIETTERQLRTTRNLISELAKGSPSTISWSKNLETNTEQHAFVFDLVENIPYTHNRGGSGPLTQLQQNP